MLNIKTIMSAEKAIKPSTVNSARNIKQCAAAGDTFVKSTIGGSCAQKPLSPIKKMAAYADLSTVKNKFGSKVLKASELKNIVSVMTEENKELTKILVEAKSMTMSRRFSADEIKTILTSNVDPNVIKKVVNSESKISGENIGYQTFSNSEIKDIAHNFNSSNPIHHKALDLLIDSRKNWETHSTSPMGAKTLSNKVGCIFRNCKNEKDLKCLESVLRLTHQDAVSPAAERIMEYLCY